MTIAEVISLEPGTRFRTTTTRKDIFWEVVSRDDSKRKYVMDMHVKQERTTIEMSFDILKICARRIVVIDGEHDARSINGKKQ